MIPSYPDEEEENNTFQVFVNTKKIDNDSFKN